MSAPFGTAILSFQNGGTTVSEASVSAVHGGNRFRLYVNASGDFKASAIGSIQSGFAVTNISTTAASVTLELFKLDGSTTGLKGSLSIQADGQTAVFLNQIPEFAFLPTPFEGTLRVSSSVSVSLVGFRGRYNERRDFLMTAIAPVNEELPASSAPLFFPQVADSGGYTVQFVLFSAQPGQSSGKLSLFSQLGADLNIMLR